MVAQTVMSPRTPTSVSSVTALYNSAFVYDAPIAYNASSVSATSGSIAQRSVTSAVASPRTVSASSMKAR
jgi:hypothetical protein